MLRRPWKIGAIFGPVACKFPGFLVVETRFWRCSGNLPRCFFSVSFAMLASRRPPWFSDAIARTKDGKTLTYFALVESVRTDAGPRQHVVAHLGELNSDQERRWQRTVVFHNRQGEAEQLRLFPDDDQRLASSRRSRHRPCAR